MKKIRVKFGIFAVLSLLGFGASACVSAPPNYKIDQRIISRYMDLCQYNQARRRAITALNRARTFNPKGRHYVEAHGKLALIMRHKKDYPAAIEYARRGLGLARANFGEEHMTTAKSYGNLAYALRDARKYKEGIAALRKKIDIILKVKGEHYFLLPLDYAALGEIYAKAGNVEKTKLYYGRGLSLSRELRSPRLRALLLPHITLDFASSLNAAGDFDGAEKQYKETIRLIQRYYKPGSYFLARTRLKYAALLRRLNRGDEASELAAKGRDTVKRGLDKLRLKYPLCDYTETEGLLKE